MQRLLFSIDKTMCFSSQYISRHKNILSLLQTVHSQQCLYTTIANQNQNTIKKHEDNKYKEMKVKDLKQLVSTRGLDLKGLTRKEQFINVLEEDDRKKFRRESISSDLTTVNKSDQIIGEEYSAEYGTRLQEEESRMEEMGEVDVEPPKKKQKANEKVSKEKGKEIVSSSATSTPTYDDKTPLADILRPHFDPNDKDDEEFYQSAVKKLRENGLFKLRDWKNLNDPELKKQFGVKVINALNIAAGTFKATQILDNILDVKSVIDIMNKIKRGPTQKPIIKQELLKIPFRGRESVAVSIYAHIKKRFLRREGTLKDDTIIAQVAGGPGMGKTRINVETENMIRAENAKDNTEEGKQIAEYLNNSVFISLSYNNETIVTDADMDAKTRTHMFWVRTLFYYLNPGMSLGEFYTLFFGGILTDHVAVEAIARYANVKWVHIAPDEYNQIADTTDGREKLKDLVKTVKAAMGTVRVDGQIILVTSLFTGTVRATATDLFEGSFGECDRIECPLLTADTIYHILRELPEDASHLKKEVIFSRSVLRAVILIGTVPRALELFLFEVLPQVDSNNTVELVMRSVSRIINRYSLDNLVRSIGGSQYISKIVAHSLLRIRINSSWKIGNKDILQLESAGFVILQNDNLGSFIIELPYVWLCVMVDAMVSVDAVASAMLKQMLQDMIYLEASPYRVAEPWQHFEVLCAQFRHIVLQLLGSMNMPLTAENVWKGALLYISPNEVLGTDIDLVKLPYLQLKDRYPFRVPNNLPESFVARNGEKANGPDGIIKLKDNVWGEQYRHSAVIHLSPNKTIPDTMLKEDYKKREESRKIFAEMNLKYRGCALISNRRRGPSIPTNLSDSIYDTVAIISFENMANHFGETIATFLHSLHRIPINYATEDELLQLFQERWPKRNNLEKLVKMVIDARKVKPFTDEESIVAVQKDLSGLLDYFIY
jgi:hypothetical protein